MSKVKRTINISKISTKTAERVSKLSEIPYERFYKWLPAGFGNYEKTKKDGRYRESCNRRNFVLKCAKDNKSKKTIYLHCNKLDCEACFISGSSIKARKINERFREFTKQCYKNGINIGKVIHFSVRFNEENYHHFETPEQYGKFKKNMIYPMLKKIGIIGGVIFLHLWTKICLKCKRKRDQCECERGIYRKKLNIHIHVLGFGYLMYVKDFQKLYPNFVYRNHLPRRVDIYHTAFYIISKLALWRNDNGTLRHAYHFFGFLHPRKFKIVHREKYKLVDKCPKCHTPRVVKKLRDIDIKHDNWIYTIKATERHYKIIDIQSLRNAVNNLRESNKK